MKTTEIIFSRHTTGATNHVFTPSSFSALAGFLEMDIQESTTGKELLGKFSNSPLPAEQTIFIGKAHNLSLDTEGTILIEATMDAELPSARLSEKAFVKCLEKWVEFLDTPTLLNMMPNLQH